MKVHREILKHSFVRLIRGITMATVRIYNLENKITGTNTLVKAETKAQVNALLRNSIVITAVGAVEALDMVSAGAKIMDATSLVVGQGEGSDEIRPTDDGAEPAASHLADEEERTVP